MTVKINAKFFRQMLAAKDLDQRELSKLSGVSEPTITRLVKGKAFTSETLGKLAEALDCHPVDLIDAEGFPSPHMAAPSAENGRT